MKFLNIALQSLYLTSTIVGAFAGGTSAGTNVGAAGMASNAAVDARVSAKDVEKGFISASSKRTYHEKLVAFSFFLLDQNPEYLADEHRTELQNHDQADKANAASRRGKKDNRTNVRNYLKGCLERVQPMRDGQHHNSPIKIDGDGAITYEVVRRFMETKTNIVVVDRSAAEAYLAEIDNGQTLTEDMVDESSGKVNLRLYQSTSQYSAIRSAISYLYKLAGVERSPSFVSDMAKFMGGMK